MILIKSSHGMRLVDVVNHLKNKYELKKEIVS